MQQERQLFITVDTFDLNGEQIGTRVVDLYHVGTRNWLQNHNWWAMHNGHTVETRTASDQEVDEYIAAQSQALADRYNTPTADSIAA